MAFVDPGELKYAITLRTKVRRKNANGMYVTEEIVESARAGVRSASGGDEVADGAARSVDTVQFIVRWALRARLSRDSSITYRGQTYKIDWMDAAPWAGGYARVKARSYDQGEV